MSRPLLALTLTLLVLGSGSVAVLVTRSSTGTTSAGSTTSTRPVPVVTTPDPGSPYSIAQGAPANAAHLAEITRPVVVHITATLSNRTGRIAGTGIALTADGEVLTAEHVIDGADAIAVRDVGDGKDYRATVVGVDHGADVAVLRLEHASGLPAAKLGDSSTVVPGAGVVAVGNGMGVGGVPSWAAGSVIATGETITVTKEGPGGTVQMHGLIATNARVVSGDSGGPLVDASGLVIGMVTAGSPSYRFHNLQDRGFAVPINQAIGIVNKLAAGRQ